MVFTGGDIFRNRLYFSYPDDGGRPGFSEENEPARLGKMPCFLVCSADGILFFRKRAFGNG